MKIKFKFSPEVSKKPAYWISFFKVLISNQIASVNVHDVKVDVLETGNATSCRMQNTSSVDVGRMQSRVVGHGVSPLFSRVYVSGVSPEPSEFVITLDVSPIQGTTPVDCKHAVYALLEQIKNVELISSAVCNTTYHTVVSHHQP